MDRREDHVLVEEVKNQFCYSDVVESAMVEQQFPKKAELPDGVIGDLGSSSAFLAIDADPYVGLHDHVDIVGPVADGQGQFAHIFDKTYNFSLLARGHSGEDH